MCEKDELEGYRCGHVVTFSHILITNTFPYCDGAVSEAGT